VKEDKKEDQYCYLYRQGKYYYPPSPLSSDRPLRLLGLEIWVLVSLNTFLP
jgi:hypothetical protein